MSMNKSTYGVGYNSRRKHKTGVDGKTTSTYRAWHNMLRRCYDQDYQEKSPTYIGCTVSEQWHDFQDFADWFHSYHCRETNYQLDKDLLIPNNKIYSPSTCCFVPRELNSILTDGAAVRGVYPQGVCFDRSAGGYSARLRINGKSKYLGNFECPDEAYQAYKLAKEVYVKEKAIEWRDRIDERVFNALMNWSLAPCDVL